MPALRRPRWIRSEAIRITRAGKTVRPVSHAQLSGKVAAPTRSDRCNHGEAVQRGPQVRRGRPRQA